MAAVTHRLINEKELFAAFADGDEVAFRQIYHHYKKRIFPFVLKMTRSGDSTEEIVQEVFIQLWLSRVSFQNVQYPTSYIFNLASNKTLNYLKKVANDANLVKKAAYDRAEWSTNTEDTIAFNESLAMINSAVSELPSQRQLIYRLSREEGLSLEEIADRLDISRSTVKNQLGHALRSIRDFLERRASMFTLLLFLLNNKK
ncbi:RNA polymerase sigma factor [Mucilaginibacter paludis]|uniref:RNA polymerase, sigma-24 subunit, ECF subfamily n=1 Tax=Mucilaginibacter paludis DSM 18603 TaxID=714943 RepID=H1XZ24_9SPHI|nr:RNA polymerase sigma-70 factor [Mucilaginibacter paludis]EHQ24609.1 RNA polymerase, sigma-24 subunit, ECF subfamily [Mucilaginibacter paludis DSM 18603]